MPRFLSQTLGALLAVAPRLSAQEALAAEEEPENFSLADEVFWRLFENGPIPPLMWLAAICLFVLASHLRKGAGWLLSGAIAFAIGGYAIYDFSNLYAHFQLRSPGVVRGECDRLLAQFSSRPAPLAGATELSLAEIPLALRERGFSQISVNSDHVLLWGGNSSLYIVYDPRGQTWKGEGRRPSFYQDFYIGRNSCF